MTGKPVTPHLQLALFMENTGAEIFVCRERLGLGGGSFSMSSIAWEVIPEPGGHKLPIRLLCSWCKSHVTLNTTSPTVRQYKPPLL